jgi:hypothetical protein
MWLHTALSNIDGRSGQRRGRLLWVSGGGASARRLAAVRLTSVGRSPNLRVKTREKCALDVNPQWLAISAIEST